MSWPAVKDLWFTVGDMSRGRALVLLKDTVKNFEEALRVAFADCAGQGDRATLTDFRGFISKIELDIYEEEVQSHYMEVCGWPEDDGDEAACNAVKCDLGESAIL